MPLYAFHSAHSFCKTSPYRLWWLTILVIGLFYGMGQVHADTNESALYIDEKGNVGIGTQQPLSILAIKGKSSPDAKSVMQSTANNGLSIDTGSLTQNEFLSGIVWTAGNNPDKPAAGIWAAIDPAKGSSVYLGTSNHLAAGIEKPALTITEDGSLEFTGDATAKSLVAVNVTTTDLEVTRKLVTKDLGAVTLSATQKIIANELKATNGLEAESISANFINGEKRPLVFEVGVKGDTQKWYAVDQDIGYLCGDADGCTMRFMLRRNSDDEVRTISEQMYIEQPDKSSNKSPGLHGWTRQLGGGDQQFVLQTSNKYELVPYPWKWIYVRNYSSPEVGPQSSAYSGYKAQFMTPPNVAATVIIYDR